MNNNFFSFRLKACDKCGLIPTVERKEALCAIVCPEGSPCREAPVFILFDPARARAAVDWWNTRQTQPLPAAIQALLAHVARHSANDWHIDVGLLPEALARSLKPHLDRSSEPDASGVTSIPGKPHGVR